jgi:hypothetical protein
MDNFIKNDQKIIEFYLTKLPTFWQNFMADMCETHITYIHWKLLALSILLIKFY